MTQGIGWNLPKVWNPVLGMVFVIQTLEDRPAIAKIENQDYY